VADIIVLLACCLFASRQVESSHLQVITMDRHENAANSVQHNDREDHEAFAAFEETDFVSDEEFAMQESLVFAEEARKALQISGIGMFVVFALSLIPYILPLQILNLNWQLSVITGVLQAAAFPAIGICLIYVSRLCIHAPHENQIELQSGLLIGARRFAAAACLGFLLLS
jgi:hypothetical protein